MSNPSGNRRCDHGFAGNRCKEKVTHFNPNTGLHWCDRHKKKRSIPIEAKKNRKTRK